MTVAFINAVELKDLLRMCPGLTLLNVRPAETDAEDLLPGSLHLPLAGLKDQAGTLLPDKDGAVAVYGADITTETSTHAADILDKLGYTKVYNFADGLKGWKAAGFGLAMFLLSFAPPAAGRAGEAFDVLVTRLKQAKPALARRQQELLKARYDLGEGPASGLKMSGGKAVQAGVRVRLKVGTSWESLAGLPPDEIKAKDLWPLGFFPLPHPHHEAGGMVFPGPLIAETQAQTGRDLTRLDLDYDLPERFLPDFPAGVFLTTRPDLGDLSKGALVTHDNYYSLFSAVLNPKQLDGLRLLVTPFPQAQFNATDDRRSRRPHPGVSCFDCHANGHTNAATHTVGDVRPNEHRRRIDTPTLRGLYAQRIFGSQRALKTVEDFSEFEQRGAYFDGDPVQAQLKGVNILERGSQVQAMAEFQSILDFPPAPKLGVMGRLDPGLASPAEIRGEKLFFGKGRCFSCHAPPYYTDNSMHNLKAERFFRERMINGRLASTDGPIKTFPLRGIKDSPPYLHDSRLLTLDDAVEFFNLILGLKLEAQEKKDLVSFLGAL